MRFAISLLCVGMPVFVAAADRPAPQVFLDSYCVKCHDAVSPKEKVRLDDISKIDSRLWQRVFEQLANGDMPPSGKIMPPQVERKEFMAHALKIASKDAVSEPGLRRLNQREYGNTVQDLLGLRQGTFDPAKFIYVDDVEDGFDTEGKQLVISNELLMEYLSAAENSLSQAVFTTQSTKPTSHEVKVNLGQMESASGRRYFNNSKTSAILRVGGSGMMQASKDTRTIDLPGRYKITITAAGVDRNRYKFEMAPHGVPIVMGFGVKQEGADSFGKVNDLHKTFELKDEVDQTFTFDVWIDKGYFPYISFPNGAKKPITQLRSAVRRGKFEAKDLDNPFVGPGVRVSDYRIEGPFYDEWPPESIRTTFDSKEFPDLSNTTARSQAVERFATRAFRRPVSKEELAPYFRYLDKQYEDTKNWSTATIRTFAAMMSSMEFLYLREQDGKLDDYALASRLSYSLWSTMPDQELFALAKSGKLKDPAVLKSQVTRMLADNRINRFSNSFADQWLGLNILGSMPPDTDQKEYKVYKKDNLESAMREETHRYFQHVLNENSSVRDFIDSDYSFVNPALASLYGIPYTGKKQEFVRVALPAQAHRGGLIGHASVLTLSANGVETSPVLRGVWVVKNFLGKSLPPPPKEVPALVADLKGVTSVRQLLEKHRSDSNCMQCHRKIDPPGFALEAFDPIGRYRTNYSKNAPVSTDGEYSGKAFQDVAGLKKILLDQDRAFARNLVVRIAEYVKGRKLHSGDLVTIETILDESMKTKYRLKDLMIQIATSDIATTR